MVNLRGNQRTQGERSRREGGKVFGQGSRAPVAITILVRNPNAKHDGCRIRYRDIGDYLKREEKLAILRAAGSIAGIDDWQEIAPDRHHDWIGQRDEAFQALYPMGSKAAKAGKSDEAIFRLFSNGYKTGRDAYAYSFSREVCAQNARRMVAAYQGALQALKDHPGHNLDEITRRYSAGLRWDREQRRRLRQRVTASFSGDHIREVAYRPFVKSHLYADYTFSQAPGLTRDIFPAFPALAENRANSRVDTKVRGVEGPVLPAGTGPSGESRHLPHKHRSQQVVLRPRHRPNARHSVHVQRPVLSPMDIRVPAGCL